MVKRKNIVNDYAPSEIIDLEHSVQSFDRNAVAELDSIEDYYGSMKAQADFFIYVLDGGISLKKFREESGYSDHDLKDININETKRQVEEFNCKRSPKRDALKRVALAIYYREKEGVQIKKDACAKAGTTIESWNKYDTNAKVAEYIKISEHKKVSEQDAVFCFNFIIETAINLQEFDYTKQWESYG